MNAFPRHLQLRNGLLPDTESQAEGVRAVGNGRQRQPTVGRGHDRRGRARELHDRPRGIALIEPGDERRSGGHGRGRLGLEGHAASVGAACDHRGPGGRVAVGRRVRVARVPAGFGRTVGTPAIRHRLIGTAVDRGVGVCWRRVEPPHRRLGGGVRDRRAPGVSPGVALQWPATAAREREHRPGDPRQRPATGSHPRILHLRR